jgi:hypothetical protein
LWFGQLGHTVRSVSRKAPEGDSADGKDKEPNGKEPSVYTILQRVSVVVGLLALAPLTRIWERDWWIRVLFVMVAVTLLAATTYDLLPRWSRRRPVILGVLLILATAAALAPEVAGKERPPPETAGRASIASPRNGQQQDLAVRESGGYTDGFVASGTCVVPRGYRALIVSLADSRTGYWLLSDGILGQCVDDGASHEWTAERVDPSWAGMKPNKPVTLAVIIVLKAIAEKAQLDTAKGEPIPLPQPAASVLIYVSRVPQS